MKKNALTELIKKQAAVKKELQAFGKEAVIELFADFFKIAPEVGHVSWTQYTPHFNDGDACTFSVGEAYCWPTEEHAATLEEEPDDYEGMALREYTNGYRDAKDKYSWVDDFESLSSTLQQAEDALEAAFGDHVRVTIHRNGTCEVDDYDHD